MSLHSYEASKRLDAQDPPFDALVMAAMRKADTKNLAALKRAFPAIWDELQERYWLPGGMTAAERGTVDR